MKFFNNYGRLLVDFYLVSPYKGDRYSVTDIHFGISVRMLSDVSLSSIVPAFRGAAKPVVIV